MFDEIYGAYYDMMRRILDKAADGPVTARDVGDIVAAHGFAESGLYFTPDALAQDGSGYNLLKKTACGYESILKHRPTRCLTRDQKRWVRTLLGDPRIRLFLDEGDEEQLKEALRDVPPFFGQGDILLTEIAADSDDYGDAAYRARFCLLLDAVKCRQPLKIVYNSSRGERKTVCIAPYRLEYRRAGR